VERVLIAENSNKITDTAGDYFQGSNWRNFSPAIGTTLLFFAKSESANF
jgi:hypothetical protein